MIYPRISKNQQECNTNELRCYTCSRKNILKRDARTSKVLNISKLNGCSRTYQEHPRISNNIPRTTKEHQETTRNMPNFSKNWEMSQFLEFLGMVLEVFLTVGWTLNGCSRTYQEHPRISNNVQTQNKKHGDFS